MFSFILKLRKGKGKSNSEKKYRYRPMAFNAEGHSRSSAENAAAFGSKHALRLLRGGNEGSASSNVRKSKASTKAHVMENTYRIEPTVTFKPGPLCTMMNETLERALSDKIYNKEECAQLVLNLVDEIRVRAKRMDCCKRYKLVCLVTVGESKNKDVFVASRCLWNKVTDNYAYATYTNLSLFASAILYAVYFE